MTQQSRLFAYGLVVVGASAIASVVLDGAGDAQSVAATAAVSIAVAAALAWFLGREHSRGMARLRDSARASAAGDPAVSPPLDGPSEIAETGAAVHSLVTQLRERERAVAAADTLLGGLLESLNEAVAVVEPGGKVIRINAAGREIFGVDDQLPFPMDRLPRARPLHQSLAAALRGNLVDPLEVEIRTRHLSLTARPLAGGGAVLAALDLTPTRKLETVRRDFVANVSHELRTPLTVVRGFAETLAGDDIEPEARRQFSEMIRANTARMQRIVDDLLDLSRIESGGWIPDPAAVDVRPVAMEALAHMAPHASEKGLALEVEIAAGADAVYADRVALAQTLTNLIENAVRHTSTGAVTVFAEPAQNGIWVGVRDTGAGIPREHLARIFERFYRADPGRSRQSGGTGLGLAIVKHLVEAHGGTVDATSDVGVGTTVRVLFPDPRE